VREEVSKNRHPEEDREHRSVAPDVFLQEEKSSRRETESASWSPTFAAS